MAKRSSKPTTGKRSGKARRSGASDNAPVHEGSSESETQAFPTVVPMENKYTGDVFYIRPCYPEYYNIVTELLDTSNGVSVTGSPGIGKSLFMAYFFERFSREHPSAVVTMVAYSGPQSIVSKMVVARAGKALKITRRSATGEMEMVFEAPEAANQSTATGANAIWLLDGIPPAIPADVRWVSFTPPCVAWHKTLLKNADTCAEVFMPMWKLDELKDAARALGRTDLFEDADGDDLLEDVDGGEVLDVRFEVYGGVPRWCLLRTGVAVQTAYEMVCTQLDSLTELEANVALKSHIVPDHASEVLHYHPIYAREARVEVSTTAFLSELVRRGYR